MSLVLFCMSFKFDFVTEIVPSLIVAIVVGLVLQIIFLILLIPFIFAGLGTLAMVLIMIPMTIIYSIYVIYDLKLIQEKIEPEEYILGALMLYADLLRLLLVLLELLGKSKR